MSEQITRASIKQSGKEFKAYYQTDNGEDRRETFSSFSEASDWMIRQEDEETATPEKAADEITIEEAEAINGNVRTLGTEHTQSGTN